MTVKLIYCIKWTSHSVTSQKKLILNVLDYLEKHRNLVQQQKKLYPFNFNHNEEEVIGLGIKKGHGIIALTSDICTTIPNTCAIQLFSYKNIVNIIKSNRKQKIEVTG